MKLSQPLTFAILASLATAITPQYKPYTKSLSETSYFEQFDLNWDARWFPSHAKKANDELSYIGSWDVEESVVLNGIKGDKGLVAKSEAALHAIMTKLPKVFENKNDTFVLQYEVKFQNSITCGGAYIKLLSANGVDELEHLGEFSDKTPYVIMFGPDKCGADNKVHFIIKTVDSQTGEEGEHHVKNPPMARVVQTTSLYTLIIEPNQDFQIRINGEVVRSGNLLDPEDFDLSPPKEIVDVNDTKPEDWVEEEDKLIIDPEDFKPEDWDETQPYLIDNSNAVMPEDWDENEPEQIPDPSDPKPDDWDDEEDGVFEPRMIDNPACLEHGCGKWIRPKIKNPLYKGIWKPRKIENPNYKGLWEPRKIPNPNYHDNVGTPSDLQPIGGIGFEIWTMDSNILFDNIYLGHSIEEVEDIGNATFIPKLKAEHAVLLEKDPKVENPAKTDDDKYLDTAIVSDMYEYALDNIAQFLSDLREYVLDVVEKPTETLLQRPGEASFFAAVIIGTFGTIIGFWTMVINITMGMINSYFEPDKTAYVGPSSKQAASLAKGKSGKGKAKGKSAKKDTEIIKETSGTTESTANETKAKKRT